MNVFMLQAVQEAFKGIEKEDGGPFGAVIVKEGRVIAKAHNRVLKENDPTSHAEMNAIRKASKKLGTFDLGGCEIYSTCMPCPMCLGAIKWANIKILYYGATSQDADNIGFRDQIFYEKEFLEFRQIERAECLKPFEAWSAKEDRVTY